MQRYIGIDVHLESCTVAVLGATGRRLRENRVETNGEVLAELVRGIAGERHICFEEGTQSEWLYELLEPVAREVVVVIPDKRSGTKNDSHDAWRLADSLRRGIESRVVFKAPNRFTALRAAVKAYNITQRDMTRAKVRLNAVYRSRGVRA